MLTGWNGSMTALPLRLKRLISCELAQPRLWGGSDGPDRRAFNVVTAPIGTSGAEFQDIAKKVASIDTLDGFLRDLRSRYPESGAVSPGGAAGEGAAGSSAVDKSKVPAPDKEPTGSIAPVLKARAQIR